jgi:putative transposase
VVVGIFPNRAAVLRVFAALLAEQNDEWLVGKRYFSEASLRLVLEPAAGTAPSPTLPLEVQAA